MWYETALKEIGIQSNLDLEIGLVPHTEDPERALRDLRRGLSLMMNQNGKRR
jgi:hypothetical protein